MNLSKTFGNVISIQKLSFIFLYALIMPGLFRCTTDKGTSPTDTQPQKITATKDNIQGVWYNSRTQTNGERFYSGVSVAKIDTINYIYTSEDSLYEFEMYSNDSNFHIEEDWTSIQNACYSRYASKVDWTTEFSGSYNDTDWSWKTNNGIQSDSVVIGIHSGTVIEAYIIGNEFFIVVQKRNTDRDGFTFIGKTTTVYRRYTKTFPPSYWTWRECN